MSPVTRVSCDTWGGVSVSLPQPQWSAPGTGRDQLLSSLPPLASQAVPACAAKAQGLLNIRDPPCIPAKHKAASPRVPPKSTWILSHYSLLSHSDKRTHLSKWSLPVTLVCSLCAFLSWCSGQLSPVPGHCMGRCQPLEPVSVGARSVVRRHTVSSGDSEEQETTCELTVNQRVQGKHCLLAFNIMIVRCF